MARKGESETLGLGENDKPEVESDRETKRESERERVRERDNE